TIWVSDDADRILLRIKLKFSSAQFGPSYNRCNSTIHDRTVGEADSFPAKPSGGQQLLGNPFATHRRRRSKASPRRIIDWFAWRRQQAERGDRFQIELASNGKVCSCLVGAQGKFHFRAVATVDFSSIQAPTD